MGDWNKPAGYHNITPYLMVTDIGSYTKFIKNALGGTETGSVDGPDGKVMHAEYKIGDSNVMLGQSWGEHKPTRGMYYLYVTNVDSAYKKAVDGGGKSVQEPKDQFYGDRAGAVSDNEGNVWW